MAFFNAQRAVHISAPGCVGTCHSLLSLNNNVPWALHCRVSSSPECRPTPCTVTQACPRCDRGRRCGVLNIAPSPRFLSSLRSVSLFLLPLELLGRRHWAGQHTPARFASEQGGFGWRVPGRFWTAGAPGVSSDTRWDPCTEPFPQRSLSYNLKRSQSLRSPHDWMLSFLPQCPKEGP